MTQEEFCKLELGRLFDYAHHVAKEFLEKYKKEICDIENPYKYFDENGDFCVTCVYNERFMFKFKLVDIFDENYVQRLKDGYKDLYESIISKEKK